MNETYYDTSTVLQIAGKLCQFYATQCWSNDTTEGSSWRSQYKVQ